MVYFYQSGGTAMEKFSSCLQYVGVAQSVIAAKMVDAIHSFSLYHCFHVLLNGLEKH
jgi:hypothetical protein